jgi:hypothetical protein
MTFRNTLFLVCALSIGFVASPTYAGDIISCDSFENCPDGSVVPNNAILELQARMDALEAENAALKTLLAGVSRLIDPNTSQDTLRFTDMNVQVVNGSETTGSATGTGNFIIGYNELRGDGNDRTGSHMLVVGDQHNYSSYGGMIIGVLNTVSGAYSSVSGGQSSTASGYTSSVSGGGANTASEYASSVSGGQSNSATNGYSSVSGGAANHAQGFNASVSGGYNNIAAGSSTSISGGSGKRADTEYCTVGDNGVSC